MLVPFHCDPDVVLHVLKPHGFSQFDLSPSDPWQAPKLSEFSKVYRASNNLQSLMQFPDNAVRDRLLGHEGTRTLVPGSDPQNIQRFNAQGNMWDSIISRPLAKFASHPVQPPAFVGSMFQIGVGHMS